MRLLACDIVRSSSPTSSGKITRCAAKYGGMKQPRSATSAQEEREAQEVGRVQDRDRDENRRAREVGEQHGVPGAEPLNEGPAGDTEDRHRRELGGEDERHLPGRPRRHQHEPREREVRHPRAEHRDDLGADERSHRGLPDVAHGEQYKTSVRFCKVGADAEDLRGAQNRTAGADPRRRPSLLRRARLRGGDGRPARGGDRPVPRRDLQLLPVEAGPVRRARRPRQLPHVGDLGERGARCGRARGRRTRPRLDLGLPRARPACAHRPRVLPDDRGTA